jgi:hypothetical protein
VVDKQHSRFVVVFLYFCALAALRKNSDEMPKRIPDREPFPAVE